MPTDLTGTATSLGIGTFNVDVDAPSGLGFNEAMAQIDTLLAERAETPAGIASGEAMIWDGSAFVRSSATGLSPSGIEGYPSDVTKALMGDGTWDVPPGHEIGYDEITGLVTVTGTSSGAPTTVISGSAYTFDGAPVIAEFFTPGAVPPGTATDSLVIGLYEGATLLNFVEVVSPASANLTIPAVLKLRFTPSAGSHTYSVKAYVPSGIASYVNAAAEGSVNWAPAFLRIVKV